MRKFLYLFIFLLITALFSGCVKPNKTGDYSNFVNRSSSEKIKTAEAEATTLRFYGVFPREISEEGKVKIRINGQGFERETKVFIQGPQQTIEAFVFNPGMLEAWMPAHYPGRFIIGVINPDGKIARWSNLFTYTET